MSEQLNILVTGASRGIGASIVSALKGHNVVGHSSAGGDGRIAADLSDPQGATALWWEALSALNGRIDVIINNAGIFEAIAVDSSDEAWESAWDRTLRVNLRASAD